MILNCHARPYTAGIIGGGGRNTGADAVRKERDRNDDAYAILPLVSCNRNTQTSSLGSSPFEARLAADSHDQEYSRTQLEGRKRSRAETQPLSYYFTQMKSHLNVTLRQRGDAACVCESVTEGVSEIVTQYIRHVT